MSPSRNSTRLRPLLALCAGLLLAGCPGEDGRLTKAPTSALWLAGQPGQLDAATRDRLAAAGIGELFVPLGDFELAGEEILRRRPLPDLPASSPVTMVVGGDLPAAVDAAAGERLAAAVQQLRFDIESRGVVPVGVHLDPRNVESFESLAGFLQGLGSALDPELYLSLSLHRDALAEQQLGAVVAAVDFVVPFVYGQLPREPDAADAWELGRLSQRLTDLEQHGVPYLLGIIGLGSASHIDASGKVRDRSTRHGLQPFLWNRDLKLRAGFSLEGANRRVYELVALRATRTGGWDLAKGDMVKVVRAATSDLAELHRLVASGDFPHLLGQLYYRLPHEDELLTLSLDNILNARQGSSVTPDLALEAQVQRRTAKGWLFRFLIANQNGELTELSFIENNYLQISTEGGGFGSDVDTGDFYRYELLRAKSDGTLERTFRNADVMRFYVPMLEGKRKVTSGDIEIRMRRPVLRLTGSFLLTNGETIEVGPWVWRDGELVDERAGAAAGGE